MRADKNRFVSFRSSGPNLCRAACRISPSDLPGKSCCWQQKATNGHLVSQRDQLVTCRSTGIGSCRIRYEYNQAHNQVGMLQDKAVSAQRVASATFFAQKETYFRRRETCLLQPGGNIAVNKSAYSAHSAPRSTLKDQMPFITQGPNTTAKCALPCGNFLCES